MRRAPVLAALALGAALVAECALRPRLLAPDAFLYADVAANLAAGRGLVQSAAGFNEPRPPAAPAWPEPFTAQPPLYPLAASALARAGVPADTAVLAFASLALLAAALLAAALARALAGADAASASLLPLAFAAAGTSLAPRAWSEPLAIAFALAALLALLAAVRASTRAAAVVASLAAGACAGLAADTRYALLLLVPYGAAWLLARAPRGARLAATLAFVAASAAAIAPVLVRNAALSGGPFGVPRTAAREPLARVLLEAWRFTFGRLPAPLLALAALAAVAALVVAARSARVRAACVARVPKDAGLVAGFAFAYALGMVALRSRVGFDALGARLLLPALAALVPLAAAIALPRAARARAVVAPCVAFVLLVAFGVVLARPLRIPDDDGMDVIARSPVLTWLWSRARPGEVVLAEDAADLAWRLRARAAGSPRFASFSPAPYGEPLARADADRVAAVAGAPLRIVVRTEAADSSAWRARYGEWLAARLAGEPEAGLEREVTLPGAVVLRIARTR